MQQGRCCIALHGSSYACLSPCSNARCQPSVKTRIYPLPQVVGLSKLKTKYESHEAKRQLCNSYDLFAADERILPSLPKLLGALRRGAGKTGSGEGPPPACSACQVPSGWLPPSACPSACHVCSAHRARVRRQGVFQEEEAACACAADGQGLGGADTQGLRGNVPLLER